MRRVELNHKGEVIEQTAMESYAAIGSYILKAVTNENITYNYLKSVVESLAEKICTVTDARGFIGYYRRNINSIKIVSEKPQKAINTRSVAICKQITGVASPVFTLFFRCFWRKMV